MRPQKVFKFTSQLIEVLIIRFLQGINSFEIEFLEHVIQAQCFFLTRISFSMSFKDLLIGMPSTRNPFLCTYSHLFNKRGAWNKHGGGAKVAKSLNVELGIDEEGGIFGKN